MNDEKSQPVIVTGEERERPAVRQIARACIALARLRLEQQPAARPTNDEQQATTPNTSGQEGQTHA